MEELKITADELTALMVSSARKGFAQGGRPAGERKMGSVTASIDAVVKGMCNTHKLKK
tara:strand:- start:301 stop:474 length:174 start_codon:yes stop_codon:yes gene_type:complete